MFKDTDGFGGFPDDLPLTSCAENQQIHLPWHVAALVFRLFNFRKGHSSQINTAIIRESLDDHIGALVLTEIGAETVHIHACLQLLTDEGIAQLHRGKLVSNLILLVHRTEQHLHQPERRQMFLTIQNEAIAARI